MSKPRYEVKKYDEIETIPDPDGATLKLVSYDLGAKHVAMTMSILAPGEKVAVHRHDEAEEIYVLAQGESEVIIDDGRVRAKAIMTFLFPAETMHGVHNTSQKEAIWLFIAGPPNEFEKAYREALLRKKSRSK